jgi:hypothetical protein
MTLTLDHIQRLNLHALLGAHRGDVATIRALWALQDKLALTLEEEASIELKREMIAGQERVTWNPLLSIPLREFELPASEFARIKAALETWNAYAVNADRSWLQPLLEAISPAQTSCDPA